MAAGSDGGDEQPRPILQSPPDKKKSYVTILEEEVSEGIDELERPNRGLILSGLSAGLDIGFSVVAVGIVYTLGGDGLPPIVFEALAATAYSVGFVLVIFGRSDLFTEHTTLAMLPVIGGRASLAQLTRVWSLVYVANLVGTALFAALFAQLGPALRIVEPGALGAMARALLDQSWSTILMSGVLAGWLMGLVSWLVTAGRDTTSQIIFVWMITSLIGLARLHHCIVGSAEALTAIFAGQDVTLAEWALFLLLSTGGNIIGGVVLVAIIKYGHATSSRPGMHAPEYWKRPNNS